MTKVEGYFLVPEHIRDNCVNCGEGESAHCNYCFCCEPDSQECPSWCDKP